MSVTPNGRYRDARGRFLPGHPFSQGHAFAGGRPKSAVKAMLREAGLNALPRIEKIAEDETHKDHYRANQFLVATGLKDIIESTHSGEGDSPAPGVNIPQWPSRENDH